MEFLLHSLVLQLFLTCLFTSGSSAEEVNCTVGEDCDLPCSGPQGKVLVLQWIKDGRHLLLYRGGRIIQNSQDQSFRGRVHLTDPELKDETLMVERGEITVTLKDVKLEDTGTYVCEGLVQTSGGKRQRFKREIHLSVSERTPGRYAARTDERGGQDLNDLELRRSETDAVTEAVTSRVSESIEDARSEKRDSDVPEATNRNDLAVILGVISAVTVVVCAVTAGVYWKRKTIMDQPQKKKNPHKTLTSPTTPTSDIGSSTPFFP